MPGESPLLLFSENELQIAALVFMAVVYALKIWWILKFPAGRDRQAPTGTPVGNGPDGARYSLLQVARPWAMSSTRQHPILYAQFVIFHVGVAASITMSFLIPYAPGVIASRTAVIVLRAIFALAFVVGALRLIRRVGGSYMRAFSTPDDYFSVSLLTVWLAFSFLAASNQPRQGEWPLLGYFFLTAFFLIYVPFSKISHYIFYPFARWYLGRTWGHRGVYPPRKSGEKFA
jgi:nitrate reductase gamma subunit